MVTVDGANTPMGRWPNAGWMIIDSATGNTSITDAALPSSPDWDGAELVIRKNHWVIDRNIITDHSGQTIAYISPSSYSGLAEYGYFIQGDIDTLDSPGEWFYDSGAAKFYMYFATDDPAGHVVKVSNIDELVHMLYVDYINLNGIRFEGANKAAFSVGASAHIGITHCEIEYCGDFGINGGVNWETGYSGSESLLVADNVINEIQNNGIEIAGEFVNATISNNIISNISTIPGMGGSGDGQYIGISIAWASGVTVEGNQIFNCGYIPLVANGAYVKIKNNYIHHYCYVKDDGGGIYTSLSIFPGREIIGNTVLYGLGALEGTPSTYPYVEGIYLDFNSADVLVANNTCAFNPIAGIYLHASHECDINNNTVFDNVYSQIYFVADNHPGEYDPIRNISMNDNVFVAKDAAQRCLSFATCTDDIAEFGTADNNCYARPIDDNYTISTQTYLWGGDITARTLETWQSYVAQDAHSHKSPKAITHANELRFEYNPANKTKTVALGGNYIDVDGNPYFGSVILLPHSSIVLIKDNTIVPESSPIVSIMMLGILISGIGCAYRKKVRHRVKPHL